MNSEQRLRFTIGDLVVELCVAQAKIDELKAELEKRDDALRDAQGQAGGKSNYDTISRENPV